MTETALPHRRGLIVGAAGLGILAATPPRVLAAVRKRPDVYGKTSWSESIMMVYLSEDLRTGISYRICRFPDLDDTWVWCQVIVDGKMYAYTDQYLPCTTARNLPDSAMATYDAPGLRARMTRLGTAADLRSMSFSFQAGCHPGTGAQEGAGHIPVSVEGVFWPSRTHPHDQTGRVERTGRIEATIRVGGKSYPIADVAKQHEQTQTGPRFLKGFSYCNMWNAEASFLGLFASDRGYGDYEIGPSGRAVETYAIVKPAPSRRFTAVLADGSRVEGVAHTAISYQIPVYDQIWLGTMVSGVVDGRKMVGTINDWRPQDQSYPATV
jgi:hypothetical protein